MDNLLWRCWSVFHHVNVAIFTSCALRHRAFAAIACKSKILNVVSVFYEEGKPLSELVECNPKADLERQHLFGRDQAEQDFFGLFLENQTLLLKLQSCSGVGLD